VFIKGRNVHVIYLHFSGLLANFKRFFIADSQRLVEATFKASIVSVHVALAVAFAFEEIAANEDGAYQAKSPNPVLEVKPSSDTCRRNREQYQRFVCIRLYHSSYSRLIFAH